MKQEMTYHIRWKFLAAGSAMCFFVGIIYAWSILKVPLREELGFSSQELATTYSITSLCFCLGSFFSGKLQRKFRPKHILTACMALAATAFCLVAALDGNDLTMLCLSYGVMAGAALGATFNCIIANTGRWYPDKRGFCNAVLCTTLGFSTIVLGSAMEFILQRPEISWRSVYIGIAVMLVLIYILNIAICAPPPEGMCFPQAKKEGPSQRVDDFETKDYTPTEMMRRISFWGVFSCNMLSCVVGLTLIGCARELIMTWDTPGEIATIIVGMMSLANAGSRIAAGLMADNLSLKRVSLFAGIIPGIGCVLLLTAIITGIAVIGMIGMIVIGFSYGFINTYMGIVVGVFYGSLHYGENFGIRGLVTAPASFLSGIFMSVFDPTETYLPLLLAMTVTSGLIFASTKLYKKP